MGEGCKELWKENKASFITVEIRRWLWQPAVIYVIVNSLRVFLARLVFLGSKQSRRTTLNKESCECGSAGTKEYMACFGVQNRRELIKKISEKSKTAVLSQAGQRESRRFFSVFKSIKSVDKSNDTLTARRRRALV